MASLQLHPSYIYAQYNINVTVTEKFMAEISYTIQSKFKDISTTWIIFQYFKALKQQYICQQ